MSHTQLWNTYYGIIRRCTKESDKRYSDYGGRGICVCDEWLNSFDSFAEWSFENGYRKGMQIDRIDNNGNYEPGNCRWVSVKTNCRNRRSNVLIEHEGKLITLVELSEILGITYKEAYSKYRKQCVKRNEL